MKKNLLAIIMAISSAALSAQSGSVGVNNSEPTETLDVNGIGRIRLLPENGTSNAIFTQPNGTKSTLRNQPFNAAKTLVADNNGVIGFVNGMPGQSPIVIAGADYNDAIPTSQTVSTRNGAVVTTPVLTSKTFTLSKRSIVTFLFNVSVFDVKAFNNASLLDGTSKRIGAELRLDNRDLIRTGIPFTNTGQKYADGYFYLDGSKMIVLEAGDHTVQLVGSVFSFSGDNIGVTATFGGTSNDQLDIVAVPF